MSPKSIILLFLFVLKFSFVYTQNVTVQKRYYDVAQTKLKSEWQQTANGHTNGYYREYYPSGKLYIDRIVKTEDVYPYWSYDIRCKIYDETGGLLWSTQSTARDVYEGEQISYVYNGPNRVVRSRALFSSGKLLTFELFRKNGTKSLELNTKSFYKTYDTNGELMDNVKIGPNGEFSGKVHQDDNEIVVEVLNGKIQKVYEKNAQQKNGNWNVYRLGNDTLVSTGKEGETYFKKYYIDTVNVKLINKPNINTGLTRIEIKELGLDFINPVYLCCKLSDKYYYNLRFYNRDFQKFIKEEIRDIKTDNLISMSEPGKDIIYHPNGKIKKIVTENDWEEFDESGKLINNAEMNKKAIYSNNYKKIVNQKAEHLSNTFGLNKYLITLYEYRTNKAYFIYNDNSAYFPNSDGQAFYTAYKVKGFNILLFEEEADALKKLLSKRDEFISKFLSDGQDKQDLLFDLSEEQTNIKEDHKEVYSAFVICASKLFESSFSVIYKQVPKDILSSKTSNDKNLIDLLSNPRFEDKRFDFNYIPDSWVEYNKNYIVLLRSYYNLIDKFNLAMVKNPSKLNKKLLGKTDPAEIEKILSTF